MSLNSIASSRPHTAQSKASPIFHTPVEKVKIPGIGIASQLPEGIVEITYPDGSRLSVTQPEHGGGVRFTETDGNQAHYTATDVLPDLVRTRLTQIPIVIKHLMAYNMYKTSPDIASSAGYTCTPVSRKIIQQPQSQQMRFFR